MFKIIRVGKKTSVFFTNGNFMEKELSDDKFKELESLNSEEEILRFMNSSYDKTKKEIKEVSLELQFINKSKILTIVNNIIYWKEASPLSVPKDFAKAIVEAELNKDEIKLVAYKNFWTLMSLNTNEECRNNLYWFLNLHGLRIAKCGFFVAYRNVVKTNTSDIYTDAHSRTTRIKIGEMVTIPREECDSDSKVECSRGLHCASAKWLKKNYFGTVGLACLVNPADVVAVPHNSEYGKLRTCAYLPMQIIHYNSDGHVIPLNVEDGFDCSYVTKVIYEGVFGTEKDSPYKIKIPKLPSMDKESIQNTLLDIAKDCVINRTLQ